MIQAPIRLAHSMTCIRRASDNVAPNGACCPAVTKANPTSEACFSPYPTSNPVELQVEDLRHGVWSIGFSRSWFFSVKQQASMILAFQGART